jgi:hypothetical protein
MSATGLFPAVDSPPVPEIRFREALDALRSEIDAIPLDQTAKIVVDIPSLVVMAGSRMEGLAAFKDEIAAKLPTFPQEKLEKLELMRLALAQAHYEYVMAASPQTNIDRLDEELGRVRDILQADFMAAAKRGLLNMQRFDDLTGETGYKNRAQDVLVMGTHFRQNWAALEGKTGVTLEEIARAEDLAQQMMTVLAARERSQVGVLPALERRSRAFTLFLRAWDEVRRAIVYLRWHEGDADRLAPSPYANRRRKSGEAAGGDDEDDQAGAATAASNGATPGAATAATSAQANPATAGVIGMPDSEPMD